MSPQRQQYIQREWRMCLINSVSPDDSGKVRNVEVLIKPRQGGTKKFVPTKPVYLKRHVSNLVLLLPAEERDDLKL